MSSTIEFSRVRPGGLIRRLCSIATPAILMWSIVGIITAWAAFDVPHYVGAVFATKPDGKVVETPLSDSDRPQGVRDFKQSLELGLVYVCRDEDELAAVLEFAKQRMKEQMKSEMDMVGK